MKSKKIIFWRKKWRDHILGIFHIRKPLMVIGNSSHEKIQKLQLFAAMEERRRLSAAPRVFFSTATSRIFFGCSGSRMPWPAHEQQSFEFTIIAGLRFSCIRANVTALHEEHRPHQSENHPLRYSEERELFGLIFSQYFVEYVLENGVFI